MQDHGIACTRGGDIGTCCTRKGHVLEQRPPDLGQVGRDQVRRRPRRPRRPRDRDCPGRVLASSDPFGCHQPQPWLSLCSSPQLLEQLLPLPRPLPWLLHPILPWAWLWLSPLALHLEHILSTSQGGVNSHRCSYMREHADIAKSRFYTRFRVKWPRWHNEPQIQMRGCLPNELELGWGRVHSSLVGILSNFKASDGGFLGWGD